VSWRQFLDDFQIFSVDHVFGVLGFALGLLLTLRLLREREKSSVTMAWLLAMLFLPWVGVPGYLLLGGRKLHQRARGKPLLPARPGAPPPATDASVARLLAVEGVPPPRQACALEWFGEGGEAWAHLVELVDGARSTLDVAFFIIGKDDVGAEFVQRLADRARAGVRVRLLVDAVGSFHTRGHFLDPLRQAGGRVGVFMPMLPVRPGRRANLRNHRKLVVADGHRAWTGGMNIAHEYLGPTPVPDRWVDLALGVRGPAVADFADVFAADWAYATGDPLDAPATPPAGCGSSRLQLVPCGPDVKLDPLADALLALVSQARRRIRIVTPYFVPDEPLQRALALQARMGRDVAVVVPAVSNHPLADVARGPSVRELVAAGGRVLLVPGKMVHAKLILIDDGPLVLGSANVDLRSLYLNFELGLITDDAALVAQAEAWLERLTHDASEAGCKEPGLSRAWMEDGARLLAPML
jgi:cardiolipin synthase